jgi:exodeoxyribonuclease V beta subunit
VRPRPPASWSGGQAGSPSLAAAEFDRTIDRTWRRTSYSSITAAAHDAAVTSEPDLRGRADDETEHDIGSASTGLDRHEREASLETDLRAIPLPLGEMAGGTRVGSVVHSVLESTDFAATDLEAELATAIESALAHRPTLLGELEQVRNGLAAAIRTPLGRLAGERSLRDIARSNRLDELDFELPIAGGDDPTGTVNVAAIADLLRRHLSAGDPMHGYDERLRDPSLDGVFHGYLTGSMDLVLRTAGTDGGHRYFVVDYKTNHLAREEHPKAWHYRPSALADAMRRAHYPLQALLYQVALHRYLRWRVAGYDPDGHLGGIVYLFLRGMTGPDVPRVDGAPCGVFAWRPPTGLILDLDELLDRGEGSP